jgi:predicted  nucleic acid-binding Zn-ribbon protein
MNCDSTKLPLLLINLGLVFLYYKNQSLDIQDSYNIKGRILGITASALLQTARPNLEKSAASYLNEDAVKHLFDAVPFVIMGGVFAYTGLARQVNLFATTLFGIQHLYTYAMVSSDPSLASDKEEGPSLSQSRFSLLFSASITLLYWQSQKPDLMYSRSVIIRVIGIALSFLTQDVIHSHLEKPKEDYKKWIFDALPFVIMGATFTLTQLAWRVNLLATVLLGRQQLYVHSWRWKEPPRTPPIPEVLPDPVTLANLYQAEITIRELEAQLQEDQTHVEEPQQNDERLNGILQDIAKAIDYNPPADEDLGVVPLYTHLVEGLHIYSEELEERIDSQKIAIEGLRREVEEKVAELEKKQHAFREIQEAFGLEITKKTRALGIEHQKALESQKEKFEKRREVLRGKLEKESKELGNLKKDHSALQTENALLRQQLGKVEDRLEKTQEKLRKLLAQNSSESKEDSHAEDLEREISILNADVKKLTDERDRLKDEKARSEATCLSLDERIITYQGSVEDLKEEKKRLEGALEKAQARIEELREKRRRYIEILQGRFNTPLSNSLSFDEIALAREHFNAEDE